MQQSEDRRISRRTLLAAAAGVSTFSFGCGWREAEAQKSENGRPKPTAAQLAWQDYEVCLLYCLDLPVFLPGGWKQIKETLDPNLYQPQKLDMNQWMEASKAAGAKYAIFTATHFNGFLQWQSDIYTYGLKQTSWRGGKADLVGDFVEACRRHGIAPGLYMSCFRNAYQKAWSHRVNWGEGGEGQAEFARTCERMVEELVSRYGPLCEIWFDAGLIHPDDGGPDVVPIVEKHQPSIVFYHGPQRRDHRWIGNESGVSGDPCWATMPALEVSEKAHHAQSVPNEMSLRDLLPTGDPKGTRWEPAMVDIPIRDHDWFWVEGRDDKVYSPEYLLKTYYNSVGRNCNFVIGAVADQDGLIPEADMKSYAALGKEVRRRFGQPVAQTAGTGTEVELELDQPGTIDHISIMEDISQGERVREFVVEGLVRADQWQVLSKGISIGHKRIERFDPVEVSRVRMRCVQSDATPQIRQLAAYNTGAAETS